MIVTYSIREGDLMVSDRETGHTTWQGRLDDCDAVDVVSLSEGDAIVLLDYICGEHRMWPFRNVLRVRPDGGVAWRAEPRHNDDVYMAVHWRDEELWATTWNGWNVQLDPESGLIGQQVFTK